MLLLLPSRFSLFYLFSSANEKFLMFYSSSICGFSSQKNLEPQHHCRSSTAYVVTISVMNSIFTRENRSQRSLFSSFTFHSCKSEITCVATPFVSGLSVCFLTVLTVSPFLCFLRFLIFFLVNYRFDASC